MVDARELETERDGGVDVEGGAGGAVGARGAGVGRDAAVVGGGGAVEDLDGTGTGFCVLDTVGEAGGLFYRYT